ncbi:hypothetical protein K7472_24515 [Streptomyces sp. PTM05]|uniref:Secreted protein n=1 Tax=Streptantibioticus parmotrematis TaxID=2873249 RepID=A0ABS7QXQ3_9ACTN|nr:hypothetical protein [Streptantibioticus parmotrematis]MBY8887979.1 hypothetical protein [Streptantibioticus parmotrematis]
MPRPTRAQCASGSATVVLSTLAMLLLSGVHEGPGVIVIALAGLALGLLVALTVATPRGVRAPEPPGAAPEPAPPSRPTARTPVSLRR